MISFICRGCFFTDKYRFKGRSVSRVLCGFRRGCHLSRIYIAVYLQPPAELCRADTDQSLSAYGVAPDRVYICTQSPVVPVSSYLAFPSLPLFSGGLFLLHFPGGFPRRTLSVILPYSARTFLTPIPFGNMTRGNPIFPMYFTIKCLFCQAFYRLFS